MYTFLHDIGYDIAADPLFAVYSKLDSNQHMYFFITKGQIQVLILWKDVRKSWDGSGLKIFACSILVLFIF